MSGYFKVYMDAAREIVSVSDGPEMLAGYMVLNRFAIKPKYSTTAAGAKAITERAGTSDFRAKLILRDLLELRFGDRGGQYLIEPTGKMIKNAREYRIGEWDGLVSYLPDLLMEGDPTPLSRLVRADAAPEIRRDALLMLAYVHATVSYAEWMGVGPSDFVSKAWRLSGETMLRGDPIDLGYMGTAAGLHFWLAEEDQTAPRLTFKRTAARLFGNDELDRFWRAHDLLHANGLLCSVAIVTTAGTSYPLWVFSPAYRQALASTGVRADLAHVIQNAASRTDIDPDNRIVSAATGTDGEDRDPDGTGLFWVVTRTGQEPTVRTVYAPLFHAATPLNLDGLADMAERTKGWAYRLETCQRRQAG